MKLTSALVDRALGQFEAEPIPEDHPVIPQLRGLFGDHTFFIDQNGLNIVEPVASREAGLQSGQVVNVASWDDDDPPTLTPHEPEPTDIFVVLASMH